jgi:hypothetical protein
MTEETTTLMYGGYIGMTYHHNRDQWVLWGHDNAKRVRPDVDEITRALAWGESE